MSFESATCSIGNLDEEAEIIDLCQAKSNLTKVLMVSTGHSVILRKARLSTVEVAITRRRRVIFEHRTDKEY